MFIDEGLYCCRARRSQSTSASDPPSPAIRRDREQRWVTLVSLTALSHCTAHSRMHSLTDSIHSYLDNYYFHSVSNRALTFIFSASRLDEAERLDDRKMGATIYKCPILTSNDYSLTCEDSTKFKLETEV